MLLPAKQGYFAYVGRLIETADLTERISSLHLYNNRLNDLLKLLVAGGQLNILKLLLERVSTCLKQTWQLLIHDNNIVFLHSA